MSQLQSVAVFHPTLLTVWLILLWDTKWCKENWTQALGINFCGESREDSGSLSDSVWFHIPADRIRTAALFTL